MLEKTTIETTAPPKVGFRLLNSEVHDLTPEVVKEFRAFEPNTATERELSNSRIKHLNDKIEHGLGVTFHWVTADLGGKIKRVNGQHSSTMLTLRGDNGQFPQGLKVHREHYQVDDDGGLASLFRQFDDRKSSRTTLDISGMYQGFHPELQNVNRVIAKLAVDGYTWYQRNVEKIPMPIGDDAYGNFNDSGLYPLLRWLDTLLAVRSKEMRHVPIIAAIVGTYIVNESAAKDFWHDVVNFPNGEDESTPQTVLSDWLIAMQAKKIDRPAPANLYQGCISAWNAFRAGKQISAIKDEIKKNFFTIHE